MPEISNSRTVNFSADRLYSVIVDVESYPDILPFIRQVTILEKTKKTTKARVSVGLSVLSFSYECIIHHKKPKYIKVDLISGPFTKLKANWQFEALSKNQCRVHYSLDSKFSNPLIEMTAGAIFATQINQSIKSFEDFLQRS